MQQVDIVLADAQGTPVNHTFSANGVISKPDGKEVMTRAEYLDRSAASAVGNWRIHADYRQRSDGTYKLKVLLALPVLETLAASTVSGITPAPMVSYTVQAAVDITLPQRATLLDRQNLRKMLYNLCNNAQIVALIESPERITS